MPSPDGRGNPFCSYVMPSTALGDKQKDCNVQQEIASKHHSTSTNIGQWSECFASFKITAR
jgi:hypothetical protein